MRLTAMHLETDVLLYVCLTGPSWASTATSRFVHLVTAWYLPHPRACRVLLDLDCSWLTLLTAAICSNVCCECRSS